MIGRAWGLRSMLFLGTMAVLAAACGAAETASPTDIVPVSPPPPSTDLTITAPLGSSTSGFAETNLAVPADTSFSITFLNDDEGIPHNVQIFEGTTTTTTPLWAPDGNAMITGVDQVTYDVPALPAGTYAYNCFSHPVTMVGTLTAV
ncbi:MAG: cupredoxin domain-containing protein [Actinomycetota bacterium]